MFYKKRIKKLEERVDDLRRSWAQEYESVSEDREAKDLLFRAAMKKIYELSGYEVMITSRFAYSDVLVEEGWSLMDKSDSGSVYYRKKKESNG